jgi:hypothetical protein
MARQVELEAVITAKDNASRTIRGVNKNLDHFGINARSFARTFDTAVKGSLLGATAAVAGIGTAAINTAINFEKSAVAFEVMLGSAKKAGSMMKDVMKFAEKTPFDLPQVVKGAENLLAFGVAQEDVIERFRMIGDVALGDKNKLATLLRMFGKIKAKGTAELEELNMAMDAGVPILKELREHFKVGRTELFKMIRAGEVTFQDMVEVFEKMTSKGGDFYQGMEKQSKTLGGVLSNLRDKATRALLAVAGVEIGDKGAEIKKGGLFDRFKKSAEGALKYIEDNQDVIKNWLEKVGQAAATYIPIAIEWIKKIWQWAVKVVNFFRSHWGKILLGIIGVVVAAIAAAGGSITGWLTLIIGTVYFVVKAFQALSALTKDIFQLIKLYIKGDILEIRLMFIKIKKAALRIWDGLVGKVRGVWNTITKTIRDKVDVIKSIVSGMWSSIKSSLPSPVQHILTGMGFQSGGIVPRTGLAMVHQGEKVIPKGAHAGPTDGGVTINVYGNVNASNEESIKNFGRTVARQFKLSQMGAA